LIPTPSLEGVTYTPNKENKKKKTKESDQITAKNSNSLQPLSNQLADITDSTATETVTLLPVSNDHHVLTDESSTLLSQSSPTATMAANLVPACSYDGTQSNQQLLTEAIMREFRELNIDFNTEVLIKSLVYVKASGERGEKTIAIVLADRKEKRTRSFEVEVFGSIIGRTVDMKQLYLLQEKEIV
jgi:hypothetical protein